VECVARLIFFAVDRIDQSHRQLRPLIDDELLWRRRWRRRWGRVVYWDRS
jgi:hypothetical protein